jgi:hypothetical protein
MAQREPVVAVFVNLALKKNNIYISSGIARGTRGARRALVFSEQCNKHPWELLAGKFKDISFLGCYVLVQRAFPD